MNRGFFFDWSGTLSNNFHSFYEVCVLMFKELGREAPRVEDVRYQMTAPYMKFWNRYFPDLPKERQDELYEKYIHQVFDPDLYEGAKETVEHLHGLGYKLFVISSDPPSKLMLEVKKSGVANLFTEVTGRVHEKGDKIATTVKNFSLASAETFYVGDMVGDVLAGRAAGVKTISVSWGYEHPDELARAQPDFLIDKISEVRGIAEGIEMAGEMG